MRRATDPPVRRHVNELAEVRWRSRVTARRKAHRRADADKSFGLARSLADQRSVQRRHKDHLFELHMAVEASEKEHQLRCARALLDERLAVEASMIDQFWLNDVPPQLHWLREPASLRLLLQRPAWLDEWLRGEEERASLLWRRLPNDLILKILQIKRQERQSTWLSTWFAVLDGDLEPGMLYVAASRPTARYRVMRFHRHAVMRFQSLCE